MDINVALARTARQLVALSGLSYRYAQYRRAVQILNSDHQTVADRRIAIKTRTKFENDVRDGILNGLFDVTEGR